MLTGSGKSVLSAVMIGMLALGPAGCDEPSAAVVGSYRMVALNDAPPPWGFEFFYVTSGTLDLTPDHRARFTLQLCPDPEPSLDCTVASDDGTWRFERLVLEVTINEHLLKGLYEDGVIVVHDESGASRFERVTGGVR